MYILIFYDKKYIHLCLYRIKYKLINILFCINNIIIRVHLIHINLNCITHNLPSIYCQLQLTALKFNSTLLSMIPSPHNCNSCAPLKQVLLPVIIANSMHCHELYFILELKQCYPLNECVKLPN